MFSPFFTAVEFLFMGLKIFFFFFYFNFFHLASHFLPSCHLDTSLVYLCCCISEIILHTILLHCLSFLPFTYLYYDHHLFIVHIIAKQIDWYSIYSFDHCSVCLPHFIFISFWRPHSTSTTTTHYCCLVSAVQYGMHHCHHTLSIAARPGRVRIAPPHTTALLYLPHFCLFFGRSVPPLHIIAALFW